MRLYKIVTYFEGKSRHDVPKDVSPDINSIIEVVDLEIEDISVRSLKELLSRKFPDLWERLPLHPDSNDRHSLIEYGRFVLVRDGNYFHYIVDFDHPDYIDLKRDMKLEIICRNFVV